MPEHRANGPESLSPCECPSSLFPELGTEGDNTPTPQVDPSPSVSPIVPRQVRPLSPTTPTQGWGQGTARRADSRAELKAVRVELNRRRQYGIQRRHAAKLQHWRDNGLPANLADLRAKFEARNDSTGGDAA